MRRSACLVTALIVATAWSISAGGPAGAKVPGSNGRIAFARFDPSIDDTVTYIVNPDGTGPRQLLPGASEAPNWSPDGRRVAVLACLDPPDCRTAAVILDPETGDLQGLSMPDPELFTACVVWSPDAKRLACEGQDEADPGRNGIYTIRTSDGRGLTRITSNAGGDDLPIDYSPDGKWLVFSRSDPNGPPGANQALFVVNVDGTGPRRITPWGFSDDDGSWSPDGTKIVFEHYGSLYTVQPDGKHLAKIALKTKSSTTAFTAFDAGWSPDGTRIVFSLRMKSGPNQVVEGIATAKADGGDVQVVTTSPTRDEKPDWGVG